MSGTGNAYVMNRVPRHPSDSGYLYFNFTNKLPSGVVLSGTPTVTTTPSGLTISSVQVNSATFVDDAIQGAPLTVAIGKGVLFKVTGLAKGTGYTVTCKATGDDSEAYGLDGEMQG